LAQGYLVRVFGLGAGEIARDESGTVVHAEVDGGDGVVLADAIGHVLRLVQDDSALGSGVRAVRVDILRSITAFAQNGYSLAEVPFLRSRRSRRWAPHLA
jgi:hypothetical protein